MRDIELPASNMSVLFASLSNKKESCKSAAIRICKDKLLEAYNNIGVDCFKRIEDRCMGKPDPNINDSTNTATTGFYSFAVSGASTIAASDANSISAGNSMKNISPAS